MQQSDDQSLVNSARNITGNYRLQAGAPSGQSIRWACIFVRLPVAACARTEDSAHPRGVQSASSRFKMKSCVDLRTLRLSSSSSCHCHTMQHTVYCFSRKP